MTPPMGYVGQDDDLVPRPRQCACTYEHSPRCTNLPDRDLDFCLACVYGCLP